MLHEYHDKERCASSLAQAVAEKLSRAMEIRGKASLVVSGGSTPKPFFQALKEKLIAWENVTITLADERWVNVSSEQSNEKLMREYLLRPEMTFVGLKNAAATPIEGEATCEQALKAVPQPFDVVVLGMGTDGHTASLFPKMCHEALYPKTDKLCKAVTAPDGQPRMTLTLPAFLRSRQLFLHITGEEKRQVYENALQSDSIEEMPVRAVLHQTKVPIDIYWAP